MKTKDLIDKYIQYMSKADKFDYEEVTKKNIYIKKWYNILKEIDKNDNKIEIINDIIHKTTEYSSIKLIAWFIRKYEPNISMKIYNFFKINDPMSELLINKWNDDQIKIEEKYSNDIEKYKKWKKDNKEEYTKAINEINYILNKL